MPLQHKVKYTVIWSSITQCDKLKATGWVSVMTHARLEMKDSTNA